MQFDNLTSKLINRPYYQTFKMVENWQTHTIIRRYNQCTKDKAGDIPGDILWWHLRKEELMLFSKRNISKLNQILGPVAQLVRAVDS